MKYHITVQLEINKRNETYMCAYVSPNLKVFKSEGEVDPIGS